GVEFVEEVELLHGGADDEGAVDVVDEGVHVVVHALEVAGGELVVRGAERFEIAADGGGQLDGFGGHAGAGGGEKGEGGGPGDQRESTEHVHLPCGAASGAGRVHDCSAAAAESMGTGSRERE